MKHQRRDTQEHKDARCSTHLVAQDRELRTAPVENRENVPRGSLSFAQLWRVAHQGHILNKCDARGPSPEHGLDTAPHKDLNEQSLKKKNRTTSSPLPHGLFDSTWDFGHGNSSCCGAGRGAQAESTFRPIDVQEEMTPV